MSDIDEKKDVSAGKWYVVHAQSGFEAKAKEGLEQRIKTLGYTDRIFDIVIPMRNVMTILGWLSELQRE